MADFYCIPVISNENQWEEHLARVMELSESKTQEELLEEAFAFDFKFKLISQ